MTRVYPALAPMSNRILAFLLALPLLACRASSVQDVRWDTCPDIQAWAERLTEGVSLRNPVVVVDATLLPGYLGKTHYLGDGYLVELETTLDPDSKVMVLVHEIAHALAAEQGDWSGRHNDAWGRAYAQVFRVLVREDS